MKGAEVFGIYVLLKGKINDTGEIQKNYYS